VEPANDTDLLLRLIGRAQQAKDAAALHFTVVNETHALVAYRQALLFEKNFSHLKPKLVCASGLVSVSEDSPFTVWVSQFVQRLLSGKDSQPQLIDYAHASSLDQPGWQEWLPDHVLLMPIKASSGQVLANVLYAREMPWQEADLSRLSQLHESYGYCLQALRHGSAKQRWIRSGFTWRASLLAYGVAALVAGSMFIPVHLSVLAPAEVVALNATAVAAPQDGVIASFAVQPNAPVKAGALLFSLDDTALVNRREVARQALSVALADEHTAKQRAFEETKGRADLAVMAGKVREKEAELAAAEAQAGRIEVRAAHDGIAVFADVNDWLGRPIQTGERVIRLARPNDVGVLIWQGVVDAINPEPGAQVRLFLHTDPLKSREATLYETSYQSVMSPENIASYRLRARFSPGQEVPRIGLRGTARVSGEEVSLGYYLFRRPLAAVREYTGW
jgi:Biotin-lipoyl like